MGLDEPALLPAEQFVIREDPRDPVRAQTQTGPDSAGPANSTTGWKGGSLMFYHQADRCGRNSYCDHGNRPYQTAVIESNEPTRHLLIRL